MTGFRDATIDPNAGGTLTVTGTTPTYALGDRLWAFYNADEVNVPLTIPSDFTLVDSYQTCSFDNNSAGIFKYTGNGGAGTPASGLPSTYSFTTSSQSFPSTVLLLFTWAGLDDTTITDVQHTNLGTNHVTNTTASLNGCNTASGDQVFIFVALDAVDNSKDFTFSATGFTQRAVLSGAAGGTAEYSSLAMLSMDAPATGSPTGTITLNITSTPLTGADAGGVMAWVLSIPTITAGTLYDVDAGTDTPAVTDSITAGTNRPSFDIFLPGKTGPFLD